MAKYPPSPSDPKRPKQMGPAKPRPVGPQLMGPPPPKRKPAPKKSNLEKIANIGMTIVDPFGARNLLKRPSKPSARPARQMPKKKVGASKASLGADASRKQKQAQAMAMEKVAAKKQAAVQSKRETAKAVKSATKKKLDNKRKTGFYGG